MHIGPTRIIFWSSTPPQNGTVCMMDPRAAKWYLVDALVDSTAKERLIQLDAECEASGQRLPKYEIPIISGALIREQNELPLAHYRPLTAWFARSPYGIHGMGHVSRVIIWADLLGVCYQGCVDRDSLLWAASLHDIGRSHDNRCLVHGQRSAEMFIANRERWNMPEDMDVEYVNYLVTNHCRPVENPTLELKILKDADALDRARLGDLDPSMLRLPETHQYVQSAQDLYNRTRSDRSLFWSVLRAAAEMRLWMKNV